MNLKQTILASDRRAIAPAIPGVIGQQRAAPRLAQVQRVID
jgi:hypothetical protein